MSNEIKHLRCTRCGDTVGIVMDDGAHYAVCHCTHDDGEIDRIPLNQLAFLDPEPWEYTEEHTVGAEKDQGAAVGNQVWIPDGAIGVVNEWRDSGAVVAYIPSAHYSAVLTVGDGVGEVHVEQSEETGEWYVYLNGPDQETDRADENTRSKSWNPVPDRIQECETENADAEH